MGTANMNWATLIGVPIGLAMAFALPIGCAWLVDSLGGGWAWVCVATVVGSSVTGRLMGAFGNQLELGLGPWHRACDLGPQRHACEG